MSLASWMLRSQALGGLQSGKLNFRSGAKNKKEDLFANYLKEDPHESFKSILFKITQFNIEVKLLLNYLNTFVKLMQHYEDRFEQISISRKDLLICLKLPLLNGASIIRSAALRSIRYTIQNELDINNLNKLSIPFLISRSLDLKNDVERTEAIKLIRKILSLSPNQFHISFIRSLISTVNEGTETKDRFLRLSLATLAEIALLNPTLFIETGGVFAITRNLIDCQIPKIAESLCGVLLLLLDHPNTRNKAKVDLNAIAAPFCEFYYKNKNGWKEKTRDECKLRLSCSRLSILTILKSWPGVLRFCNPKDRGGFYAIVDVLNLKQREIRKAVLDLLFDLLGLQQPEWTDELSLALNAIDPCEPQSSWRLKEGFVAAEGKSILPHLAKTTPSPTEIHLALLLFCFLECGLLESLTEVITSNDTFISVRATVLLCETLRLIALYLPPGCCNSSVFLSALVGYATKRKPQAMAAITAIEQLHKIMQKRPASYSLHLDFIIRNNNSNRKDKLKQDRSRKNKGLKSKLNQVKAALKDGDGDIVKETGVFSTNFELWNWSLIKLILKAEHEPKLDLTDSSHKLFLKRLLDFFTPSRNNYSHTDLGNSPNDSYKLTTSGIEFIKFLGDVKDQDCQNMVLELFKDIHSHIKAISTSRSVHDCLFSPSHMVKTHCQSYFLFIGQFVASESGKGILESIQMFSLLQELATATRHDCYVKLIISSLDYSEPGPAREILDAVLTCNIESSRLYATQFLLVLLRAGYPTFAGWAVRLLCRQLEDESTKVRLSALATLQEACELPDCLETLTDLSLNLTKLAEKGELLTIRSLSTEKGYKKCGDEKILSVLSRWDGYLNCRYVKIVEAEISDSLTLHQRTEDGKYERVVSSSSATRSHCRKDIFLPPHLYGQLNQHPDGFRMLTANSSIPSLVETIREGSCNTEDEIIKLKSALWAIGHFSTSYRGFNYLNQLDFVSFMIRLVTSSAVYGVRSTAFYSLSLVATTSLGADELCLNGWLATRHNRHDRYPIIQEELMDNLYLSLLTESILDDKCNNTDVTSEEDEITLSEEDDRLLLSEYSTDALKLDSVKTAKRVKQFTLPSGSEIIHIRSLSESKTFDTSNGYELMLKHGNNNASIIKRQRNSSVTESSTTGVSSSDSVTIRPEEPLAYLRTLSPIPSSTSLSALKLSLQVERRSHRISSNSASSDISTSSISANNSNELTLQNMIGYQTIRYIRRRDSLNFRRTERDDYLFRAPTQFRSSATFEVLSATEPSATIHYVNFDQQKFNSIYEFRRAYKPKDAIYRGICLPKNLCLIFPSNEAEDKQVKNNGSSNFLLKNESSKDVFGVKSTATVKWNHSKNTCILCSQEETAITDAFSEESNLEILKLAEHSANPVFSKLLKIQLLRLKQRDQIIFKDPCIYSEICKMFSESAYCLITRRTLHELFFDVNFEQCYETTKKVLESIFVSKEPNSHCQITNNNQESSTEFKTLDSLKLISTENKFPIKTKKNTN